MARNRAGAVAAPTGDNGLTTQRIRIPTNGPHDGDTLAPEITPAPGTVDFGAVRVPLPVGGTVSVEPTTAGRIQAVHVTVPEGRLSVSALAAPRTGGLWAELATEIDVSLREGGARVRSFTGEWGRELHATTDGATSLFVGVDGPRWMLYGVATGPTRDAVNLDARLRRMLRGTIVVRGRSPYPVRTVLPLVAPSEGGAAEGGAAEGGAAEQAGSSAPPTMTLRTPASALRALTAGAQQTAAVNGTAVNGTANGAAPNGARPRTTNGALPAVTAGGAAPNGVANGVAPNGLVHGAASNGVGSPEVSSGPGSSTTGGTRKGVPAPGGSTGGTRKGVPLPGGSAGAATPASIPAASQRRQRRAAANGAAVPGVPFPGVPTNGASRAGATQSGADPNRANGANKAWSTRRGGNPGATDINAHDTGVNRSGPARPPAYPIGATNIAHTETGTSPYGLPANGAPPHQVASDAATNVGAATGAATAATPTGALWGGGPAGPVWSPARGSDPAGTTGGYPAPSSTNRLDRQAHGVPLGPPAGQAAGRTGGYPRPEVPTAWAHETGGHRRRPVGTAADGSVATPYAGPRATGTPAEASPPTAAPSAPPPVAGALHLPPETSPSPKSPESLSTAGPLSPLPETPSSPEPRSMGASVADWRPSWADAAPGRGATGRWDPLVDPLPVDLDPLPAPDPLWAVGRPGGSDSRYGDSAVPPRRRASRRGDRDDAEELASGGTAPRWSAADLFQNRDGAVGAADGPTSRRSAADLPESMHDSADAVAPTWPAADLLAERGGDGGAATIGRATDGPGSRARADEAGDGAAAPRWLAAGLLEGRDELGRAAGAGRSGRRRATTSDSRDGAPEPVDGPAEPRRGATLDVGRTATAEGGVAAPRWRAANLLGGCHDDAGAASAWPAAELLDGRNGGLGDAAAVSRPRAEEPDDGRNGGFRGDAPAASRWLAEPGRGGETAAPSRRRAADLPEGRERSAGARTWAAADLLDARERTGDVEGGASAQPDPEYGSAEPSPDTRAGRRRRSTGTRNASIPSGALTDGGPRRRTPTTAETRHGNAGHHDDAQPRHAGGNRHTAAPPPRVPPTQWAWPKEEPAPDPVPTRRSDDDVRPSAWSAADLLDEGRHAGGRRRKPEPTRHRGPTDDHAEDAGRHYRA